MFKKAIFMYILAISVLYAETPVVKPKRFLKGQVKIDGIIAKEEWGDFKPIENILISGHLFKNKRARGYDDI